MRFIATTSVVMLAIVPCAAVMADQADARLLLDGTLHGRQIRLMGIDSQQVAFRDSAGLLRSEPVHRVVAITSEHRHAPSPDLILDGPGAIGILELTDGQRIIGRLLTSAAEAGDIVRWVHPLLGEMEFRLDDIQRMALRASDTNLDQVDAAAGDVLVLRNGDRLEGFVESISAEVRFEVGGQSRELPVDRIAGIVLANPSAALTGPVLWMRDGSIIASSAFAHVPEGQMAFVPRAGRTADQSPPGSESMALPVTIQEVLAVAFEAERIAPLASLRIARQEPTEGRRWTRTIQQSGPVPALLNAPDLELPGPMVVEWELPVGASHFATVAELPRANWNWGDCILVVSLVEGRGESERASEVSRSRINADNPLVAIRFGVESVARPMTGPLRLRMRLDPGLYGPVQDQIVLRRPMVLLEPEAR